MNCSALTSPSWNGECVSSSTSHACPTLCIHVPIRDTSCPPQNKRKSRCRSALSEAIPLMRSSLGTLRQVVKWDLPIARSRAQA